MGIHIHMHSVSLSLSYLRLGVDLDGGLSLRRGPPIHREVLFVGLQHVPDTTEGNARLGELGDDIREHEERHAEDVEERDAGERARGIELARVEYGEHGEGADADHDGDRGDEEVVRGAQLGGAEEPVELGAPCGSDLVLETLLPGVHLDHAHRPHHLPHQLGPLVRLPRRLPHELTRAHHELELERDRQDEDHHPHERGAAQLLRVVGVED